MIQNKLAFMGKMQVGKDTSADIWQKIHPGSAYTRLAFASALKIMTATLLDIPSWLFYTTEGKNTMVEKYGKTARQLLQDVGEGFRTFIHRDFWVMKMEEELDREDSLQCFDTILITDVRYPNEAKMLKGRGFTVIGIRRDTGIEDNHPSEQIDYSLCDYVVDNNGTLDDLKNKLLEIPEFRA